MSNSISNLILLLPTLVAILLTSIIVKWLDDAIDEESGNKGIQNYAAYALAGILLAAALDLEITFVLFMACYSVGMFGSGKTMLPSGLPNWLESGIALTIVVVVAGFTTAIWAVAIIVAIQAFDDILDYNYDSQHNQPNWIFQLGIERTLIIFFFSFYLSWLINSWLSFFALGSALVVGNTNWIFRREVGEDVYSD